MSLFTQSVKPWVSAVQEIAECAGASADTEMTARAHRSLQAAFMYFNTKKWQFLLTEGAPINVYAPLGITGVSASANQTSAACPVGHGFFVDDFLSGTPFVNGTRISATAADSIGLNVTVTAGIGAGVQVYSVTAIRDSYALPSNWKAAYSVRMLTLQRALRQINRRVYDRSVSTEMSTTTPLHYDIFGIGEKGRLRLIGPPGAADVLQLRYYRRMDIASASGVTAALDIPQDYELYPIAWGKWHFLMDKADGRGDQATTWLQLSKEGMTTMISDQATLPDEDVMFLPGSYAYESRNPNSPRQYLDEW